MGLLDALGVRTRGQAEQAERQIAIAMRAARRREEEDQELLTAVRALLGTKTTTLRLRRIRVSYDWFQSLTGRDREVFWKGVEAVFGVDAPWDLDSQVEFSCFQGEHKLRIERK